jgi:hypothetical protein
LCREIEAEAEVEAEREERPEGGVVGRGMLAGNGDDMCREPSPRASGSVISALKLQWGKTTIWKSNEDLAEETGVGDQQPPSITSIQSSRLSSSELFS